MLRVTYDKKADVVALVQNASFKKAIATVMTGREDLQALDKDLLGLLQSNKAITVVVLIS